MKLIKYLFCVLFICISCSKIKESNKKEIIHPTEENFLAKENVNFLINTSQSSNYLSKILRGKKPVAAIGEPQVLFSGIDKVVINNGFVFILDEREKRVAKFSIDGRFITNIGNEGRGPGEFSFPNDFANYKKDVFISDRLFSIKRAHLKK